MTNEKSTQKARALVDIGATSSISLGHLFAPDKLQNNLLPAEWTQKSTSFATNKFSVLKFMLPEFTESSIVVFPIHVDMSASHCNQPHDIMLGLDAIVELGVIIDGKNKTITWEDDSIPLKCASGASPLSDEIAIGEPMFATIQPVEKGFMSDKLNNSM